MSATLTSAINPRHYNGRYCADIGERLTANGYQMLKYVWRLGRKDSEDIELGKAAWYADSECSMFMSLAAAGVNMRSYPLTLDIPDTQAFLELRIADQPVFTQSIARLLWRGYNVDEIHVIRNLLNTERDRYAGS